MSETTQTQLPAWAKDAGWTAQDLADGWEIRPNCMAWGRFGYAVRALRISVLIGREEDSAEIHATSPAAARTCAIDIVNAIKRARGEQG
jgi:hypothetical protein